MMAAQGKNPDQASGSAQTDATQGGAQTDEALKPFQDASTKLLQAQAAAQQDAFKQYAQTWLDFQGKIRDTEQAANSAVLAATKKHVDRIAQPVKGSPEEVYAAQAQAQIDYETEVRKIYADAEAKVQALVQQTSSDGGDGGGDAAKKLADQQQGAYQAYVADVQQAWSKTKAVDPQTVAAIASHILYTVSQTPQAS